MNSLNDDEETLQPKAVSTTIIEYSNYILIVSLLIINVLVGLVVIENGSIKINDFKGYVWLDWMLWVILTFVPPVISVIVRTIFQKEGIDRSKITFEPLVDEYFELMKNDTTKKVRSEQEYLNENTRKKMFKTLFTTLIISFFSGNIIYGFDKTGIVRLLINLITTLVVGFLAFTSSYSYGVSELKSWYILEISRLKKLDYDEMVKSGKFISGGK